MKIEADDLQDTLNEAFEEFLQTLDGDKRFVRGVTEDDMVPEEWTVMYTTRGQTLIENYLRRLYKIASKHFPNEDFEIYSSYYEEA